MHKPTREALKKIFKKVKHLRLDKCLEEVDFAVLTFYSWIDETDQVLYMLYGYRNEPTGIRWKLTTKNKPKRLEMCEICQKHRRSDEVTLVVAKTRHLPKGIFYRSRGNYICLNYRQCNQDMKDTTGIDRMYDSIWEDDS